VLIPVSVSIHRPSVSFDGCRNWRQTTSFGATVCSINFSWGSKFVGRLLTSVWFAGASYCGAAICGTHHWRSPDLVSCRRHTLSCRQSRNAQLDITDITQTQTHQDLHCFISPMLPLGDNLRRQQAQLTFGTCCGQSFQHSVQHESCSKLDPKHT